MKYLYITLVLLFASCATTKYAPIEKGEDPSHHERVIEFNGQSKDQLFSKAKKWVAIYYNSANFVTQLSDKDAGELLMKGNSRVQCVKMLGALLSRDVTHTLAISVKDNKIRVVMDYNTLIFEATKYNSRGEYNVKEIFQKTNYGLHLKDHVVFKDGLIKDYNNTCNTIIEFFNDKKNTDW